MRVTRCVRVAVRTSREARQNNAIARLSIMAANGNSTVLYCISISVEWIEASQR